MTEKPKKSVMIDYYSLDKNKPKLINTIKNFVILHHKKFIESHNVNSLQNLIKQNESELDGINRLKDKNDYLLVSKNDEIIKIRTELEKIQNKKEKDEKIVDLRKRIDLQQRKLDKSTDSKNKNEIRKQLNHLKSEYASVNANYDNEISDISRKEKKATNELIKISDNSETIKKRIESKLLQIQNTRERIQSQIKYNEETGVEIQKQLKLNQESYNNLVNGYKIEMQNILSNISKDDTKQINKISEKYNKKIKLAKEKFEKQNKKTFELNICNKHANKINKLQAKNNLFVDPDKYNMDKANRKMLNYKMANSIFKLGILVSSVVALLTLNPILILAPVVCGICSLITSYKAWEHSVSYDNWSNKVNKKREQSLQKEFVVDKVAQNQSSNNELSAEESLKQNNKVNFVPNKVESNTIKSEENVM